MSSPGKPVSAEWFARMETFTTNSVLLVCRNLQALPGISCQPRGGSWMLRDRGNFDITDSPGHWQGAYRIRRSFYLRFQSPDFAKVLQHSPGLRKRNESEKPTAGCNFCGNSWPDKAIAPYRIAVWRYRFVSKLRTGYSWALASQDFLSLEARFYRSASGLEWSDFNWGTLLFGVLLRLKPSITAEPERITIAAYHWHPSNSNRAANLSIDIFL